MSLIHLPDTDATTPAPDNTAAATQVDALAWRGVQHWVCGVVAVWEQATGWYQLDWGDGATDIAHPDLPARTHSYVTDNICDNIAATVTARPLYRDGTTGPVAAQAQVQARGRGAPSHRLTLNDDGRTVTANLSRWEKPIGYSIGWDDGTPLQYLDDGSSYASHTYPAGPSRRPSIAVLDRPARRMWWPTAPAINPTRKHETEPQSMGTFNANFTVASSWDGGYVASYRVTHQKVDGSGTNALPWEISFVLDEPAVIADMWGAGAPKQSDVHRAADYYSAGAPQKAVPPLAIYSKGKQPNGGRVYVIKGHKPLPVGESVDVGFRVEPAGAPARQPRECSINGHPCFNDDTTPVPPPPGHDTKPPTQPLDLVVKTAGPRTLGLAWRESTDDIGVAVYDIEVDGDIYTQVHAPASSGTLTGLSPETSYEVRVRARDRAANTSVWSNKATGTTTAAAAAVEAPEWDAPVAPFVDLCAWLQDKGDGIVGTPDLTKFMQATGVKAFNLGFIVNNGWADAKLDPCWGGQPPYATSSGWARDNVAAFTKAGGTPIISFGGENGSEIANHVTDVDNLVAAYQHIIDTYGVKHVDFDIEGGEQTKLNVLARRFDAVNRLQAANPDLKVALTLPVLPEGLVPDGLRVVRTAVEHGVKISIINVMAMCFNRHNVDMGEAVIQTADSVHAQLAEFYPNETAKQRWRRVAICPMFGYNNSPPHFQLTHAKQLTDYAIHRGFALTGWDATRDRNACVGGGLYACTDVPQEPFEFTKIFKARQDAAATKAH